jgi:long-chain acyl-CoA synthetase
MLARLLDPALAADPQRVAVSTGDGTRTLTYRQLEDQAARLAGHFVRDAKLSPQDRVALWLHNGPDLLVAYLACWKAGLIPVPLDYRYQPRQVQFILNDCSTRAAIVAAERQHDLAATDFVPNLESILVADGEPTLDRAVSFGAIVHGPDRGVLPDPCARHDIAAVIFYTSGTTSRPKGVVHSDRRLCRRLDKVVRDCRLDAGCVSLITLSLMRPLSFQVQALALLAVGGRVTTLPRFSADVFWRAYQLPPAKTLLAFTPNMLADVLAHPAAHTADHSALRICLCGGDAIPMPLHALFAERTGKELVEICGMTETGPYAMNPPFGVKKPGYIGRPIEGTCVRIVDAHDQDVPHGQRGEIVVRSPDAMVGYWNDTLRTMQVQSDGWLHTGDIGHSDDEGYLHFDGRLREIIVRDGSNISPTQVEEALESHPAVHEAIVVGVDDGQHGQAVEAFLCWRDDIAEGPSLRVILEHTAARLQNLPSPSSLASFSRVRSRARASPSRRGG